MKKLKPIPTFKTEAQERKFWEKDDSADYVDLREAQRALSELEGLNDHDFNSTARELAPADQNRRQQVRRAVSVDDQNVAGGEGRLIKLNALLGAKVTRRFVDNWKLPEYYFFVKVIQCEK
jgi:hypothetical protein